MRVSADDMQLEMYSTYRHKKTHLKNQMCFLVFRQRLTFPGGRPPSIISAKELNYCVRDGNRCDLFAIATEYMSNTLRCIDPLYSLCQKLNEEVSVLCFSVLYL